MTLDKRLEEILKTADKQGHLYIVALPSRQKLTESLILVPLARYNLSQKLPSKINGNGFDAVFGKISDFSTSYKEIFLKKCTELNCEIKFETL